MRISKRLKIIHDMVPKSVVADIGSDHGKLMIALVQSETISKGYAVENKEGPFERLKNSLTINGVIDRVTPLFSDGIKDLPKDVKTVVIAGMGGLSIVNILKKHQEKLKYVETIIVDAHSAVPTVRKEICLLGYAIADEKIIKEDNIFYEIIKFIKAEKAIISDEDLEFGPILRHEKSVTFKEKYQNRLSEINALLAKGELPPARIASLNAEKQKLERNL